jgi:hypothetical protein
MKPAEPERGREQFQCPEYIPRQCLLKSLTIDRGEPCGRPVESIGMMWGDYQLLAIGRRSWSQQ